MKGRFKIKPFEVDAKLMPDGVFWRVEMDGHLIETIKHSLFIEKYDPADLETDRMMDEIAKAK